MKKTIRILIRIIVLPFVLVWQFADKDSLPSLKAIKDWMFLAKYQDHSPQAQFEMEMDVQSKVK